MGIKADGNMIKRVISSFIIGWTCFGCLLAGGLPLFIMIGVISTIGSLEFVKILNHKGFYPFKSVIIFSNLLILLLVSLKANELLPLVFCVATTLAFLAVIFRGRQPYIANVATTALGFLYLGWLPAHIIMIRQLETVGIGFIKPEMSNGVVYLLMFFLSVMLTDIGAFYIGKKFGKHKLCPVISPNKTVEGAIGGGISALIICLVVAWFTGLNFIHSVLIAILTTIFAQLGDLSESLLKRDAGVKDSGASIPGHGGFLDRTDGYIFASPIIFYYVNFIILHNDFGFMTRILELIHGIG